MRPDTDKTADKARRRKSLRERGVALIAVMTVIAIVAGVTTDFSYETNVDYAAAANARDDMRAHFLAVSGMNLSRLVIKVQNSVFDRYRSMLGDMQLADYLPMIMGAFGGGKEEIAAMTEAMGIGGGDLKGLGVPAGEFGVTVTTDDSKINVNCARGNDGTVEQLERMLTLLVAPPAFNKIFETVDGDGQMTDRATFVKAIIDYIDADEAGYGGNGAPEDYGYERRKDPYRAKNNYLDSVDELRLVRGMDDQRWAIFGKAFTVYGGCKVNLAAIDDIVLMAAIIGETAVNPNDPVLRDPTGAKLFALSARVVGARSMGFSFDSIDQFVDFVKNPDVLTGLFGLPGLAPPVADTTQSGTGAARVEGVELDKKKLAAIATTGGRRTYRVEASARIGKVEKKITGVWDVNNQNQNMRDPAYNKGSWVYWRED